MTCPNELSLAMHADGALSAAEAAVVESHLASCSRCRFRLAALQAEAAMFAAALGQDVEGVVVPVFERPASRAELLAVALVVLVGAGLVEVGRAFLEAALPTVLAWFDPFDAGGVADLAVRAAIFVVEDGAAIMRSISETAAAAVVTGFVVWIVLSLRRRRSALLLTGALACLVGLAPAPSQALELRHARDGVVLVAADETIHDTLVAAGETVEINGDVEGDLIALGRRVVIRGRVGGQVFTVAQAATLDGDVDGSVLGIAQTLRVSPERIGRNLYAIGSTVEAAERTRIDENVVVLAQRLTLAGPIGRDVIGAGEEVEVGNAIGGGLTAAASRITLLAPARIEGDVQIYVPAEERVTISPGATIGGRLDVQVRAETERRSKYARGGFYVAQVLRYAAAFLAGAILLALLPSLRRVSLDSVGAVLTAAGVGIVTLVATPVIALLVAATVIGIPVALLGVMLWVVGLYLAKIVLAHYIGSRLVSTARYERHYTVALAVGLLVVIVAVNLPLLGGLLNFLLTICGLGLLALMAWRGLRRDTLPERTSV